MPCNCSSPALSEIFGERWAQWEARRFRRHGIASRATRLLEALAGEVPLEGATALEVGAGIGGLSIALLGRGAAHAHAIDASPAAATIARELAAERGAADRLSVEVGDFAERDAPERYDIVVLDRVVCCYPRWRALLVPATAAARRAVAMTYPRDVWFTRAFRRLLNAWMTLFRKEFRFYIHPPAEMLALLRERGLRPRIVGRAGMWELVVALQETEAARAPRTGPPGVAERSTTAPPG